MAKKSTKKAAKADDQELEQEQLPDPPQPEVATFRRGGHHVDGVRQERKEEPATAPASITPTASAEAQTEVKNDG